MDIETLKGLHWQTLKKMMEDAGLVFKSKDQAIEELSKLQAPAGDPAATPPTDSTAADADAAVTSDSAAAGDPPPADPVITDPTPADPAPAAEDPAPTGPRFDRRKPYGEICGDIPEAPGARFLQGGHYFNNAGDVVGKA